MGVCASADLNKERGTLGSDKPPVLTLVGRSDGQVRFLVCEDLQEADEDISKYGDGSVILCTDGYTIYTLGCDSVRPQDTISTSIDPGSLELCRDD